MGLTEVQGAVVSTVSGWVALHVVDAKPLGLGLWLGRDFD